MRFFLIGLMSGCAGRDPEEEYVNDDSDCTLFAPEQEAQCALNWDPSESLGDGGLSVAYDPKYVEILDWAAGNEHNIGGEASITLDYALGSRGEYESDDFDGNQLFFGWNGNFAVLESTLVDGSCDPIINWMETWEEYQEEYQGSDMIPWCGSVDGYPAWHMQSDDHATISEVVIIQDGDLLHVIAWDATYETHETTGDIERILYALRGGVVLGD